MPRKKKKKHSPLIVYLFISMLIITSITIGLIYFIDILPFNYFSLLTGLILVIDLIFSVMLFSSKPVVKVFGGLVTTFYILIMILAIIYELNTIDFLKKIGDKEYITLNYNVVVLKSSSYTDLPSIKGEKVGIVNGYKEEVTSKLDKKVKVKYTSYSNYSELVDRLINKHINVVLLEDSQYKILEEEYTGFENKVSVIYKFSVDVKQKTEKEKTDITKKPFNIFISGIDTYGNINSVSRSDVNMIMSINPTDKKILLTSIPRDYYVKLSGINEYDKLTHAGMYGIDTSIDTVETLLDTKINYYIKVNFSSLVKVVNTLDGIDVDSKYQFTSQDGYSFKKGINHLNGKKALSFARERKALPDGDRSRGENHQAVLAAIINKASSKSILTNYNSLLKSLKPSTSFIKMQIDKDIKWNITYVNLDGSDGYEYTYSYAKNKLYVMIPDEETVENAKEEIRKILEK